MPTLQVFGQVVPTSILADVYDLPAINWKSDRSDLSAVFEISCSKSRIHLVAKLEREPNPEESEFVFSALLDSIQTIIDIISFRDNLYATVVIERLIDTKGVESVLVYRMKNALLRNSITSERFGDLIGVLLNDLPAAIALHDLVTSLYRRHLSVTLCARAVEAIRNNISPSERRDLQWATMRAHLNLEKSYIELVTGASTAPRHGDHSFISGGIAMEVQFRAFEIMNRFLEYKLRNCNPLNQIGHLQKPPH